MSRETKNEVYEFIVKCTFEFCSNQLLKCDSSYLSKRLNISRSLASQYLNEFYRDGIFLKVQTRPVYFLDRHTLESVYQIKLENNEFYDEKELTDQFGRSLRTKRSFLKAVGHDTSLSECILQCQSAIKYPPNGLPILLYGERGVGKTFFTRLIYQYAIEESLIDKDARLVFFNESQYEESNGREKDVQIIFGTYLDDGSQKYLGGLIARAKNGILVIENVERLSPQCYFLLIQYMQSGEYTISSGKQGKVFKSRTRIIFTSCIDSKQNIHNAFFHSIPIICHIPSLQNRPIEDKEMLIIEFFKEEGLRLKKNILISSKAFIALVNRTYENNIEELSTCIQSSCANAYLSHDVSDDLHIYLYHLPVSIINSLTLDKSNSEEEYMIDICKYLPQTKNGRIIDFFDFIVTAYREYEKGSIDLKLFLERCIDNMNVYYDYIVFEHKYYNARVRAYEKAVLDVFEHMLDRYDIYIPSNCAFVVARVIYSYMQMFSSIRSYEVQHAEEISKVIHLLKEHYPTGYRSAMEIMTKIRQTIDVEINDMNLIFLILNIQFYNRSIDKYRYNCIIISHGYSTASSIADAANKLIGSHIMEGIDMPVSTSMDDIVMKLRKYINDNSIRKDLILLVDMGSLENIGTQLIEECGINIGIINNVSTRMALHVAGEIRRNVEMKEILSKVSRETVCEYKIFSNINRKKAIIFTSETGMEAIERVVQLFKNSMPRQIDISIFAYDCLSLQKNKEQDDIFKLYDVLFIVTTTRLDIRNVSSVPMEDVIAFKDVDSITSTLNSYFTKNEQEQFNRNLIKNFTLENVMNYLTVLNADKLITFIEEALDHLQELLGMLIANETMVGMYIHISCIIERLVMKNEIAQKERGYSLDVEQKRFQKMFNDSFARIMDYYKVDIPVSEILYMYDYIFKK